MQSDKKKHSLRNVLLALILLLFVGGVAYGISRYQSIKNSVDKSFKSSGLEKKRQSGPTLKSKKPISILLLGTDTGALDRNFKGRTDSMMVVTLNPKVERTTITSIPRDTAVNIPGFEDKSPAKINAAYAYGQTKTAINTVQKLLNIPIDFYAQINLGGLKKVVNQVGGIEITPSQDFQWLNHSFTKGKSTHMDGDTALAYAGMRYSDPKGDYGRQARQREVLTAIVKKSSSISSLLNQPFIDSLSDQIQTDLTFDDLKSLAKNYRGARKYTMENHLQGTGAKVADQSMEIVDQIELQRVTNFIRGNLELPAAETGNIQYVAGN